MWGDGTGKKGRVGAGKEKNVNCFKSWAGLSRVGIFQGLQLPLQFRDLEMDRGAML